nr:MAG TPA: hypothetical protein [Caudoviricetes sp.]
MNCVNQPQRGVVSKGGIFMKEHRCGKPAISFSEGGRT